MNIGFWKMHGASNDFILVDDRKLSFPVKDSKWIEKISSRRTGVGCEGVMLIQPSKKASFKMRFFNPDGSEADMCGNGARCISRLAYDIKVAPSSMTIETCAGILKSRIIKDKVMLTMTTPRDWRLKRKINVAGKKFIYGFVNSGVPHAVVESPSLEKLDIQKLGAAIRYHKEFAPAGTNANFIHVTGKNRLSLRTYERGVEAETHACGTGMVASALIAAKLGRVKAPVQVIPKSGDTIIVDFKLTDSGAENVTMLGPAEYVFKGTLIY